MSQEDLYEQLDACEGISEFSDYQVQQIYRIISDPLLFIESTLKIQNKRGDLVDFHLNKPQLRLYEEYKRQRDEGKPIRIIILKARQMGFSTLVSALFYQAAVTRKNTNAMVMAHKADASTNIFNKQRLYYETSPEYLQPMRKASNAKEMVFENPTTNGLHKKKNPGLRSRIVISTAVNKDAGRSATFHYLHLSELAFWPFAEETMTSVMQTVPNLPETAIIIESTANGIGGAFYDEWVRAENGQSEFTPIFFPWYEMDEYRMPAKDLELTEDELELKEQFGLDDEQLAWRRWCITANCMGDLDKFHQEYPATPHEAFLASGRPVFDQALLDGAIRRAQKPKYEGRVVRDGNAFKFRTEHKGFLKMWEPPQPNVDYVIGADVASGEANGDYSAAAVIRSDTGEQVAEWWGHIPPDLFGQELDALGRYYNTAWLIPEANNHGVSTIDALRRLRYPHMYRRKPTPDNMRTDSQDRYGWWTSEQSKKLLIDGFAKFIRDGAHRIKSKETLKECVTYVYDDLGRSNAQTGCYDDRVIASALAVYGLYLKRPVSKELEDVDVTELYQITSATGY